MELKDVLKMIFSSDLPELTQHGCSIDFAAFVVVIILVIKKTASQAYPRQCDSWRSIYESTIFHRLLTYLRCEDTIDDEEG